MVRNIAPYQYFGPIIDVADMTDIMEMIHHIVDTVRQDSR